MTTPPHQITEGQTDVNKIIKALSWIAWAIWCGCLFIGFTIFALALALLET